MIRIGTRGSPLALAQTISVHKRMLHLFPEEDLEIKVIKTSGDINTTGSLRAPSNAGVFVKELEQALLNRDIDLAVHSMKDVPTQIAADFEIAAVAEREDARDALIANQDVTLSGLPEGSRVGTGSLRRQAQLLSLRPDLKITDIRGNLETRLKKLQDGSYDAIVLACAGIRRLGFQNLISSILDYAEMLPAPGQGALAIESRRGDSRIKPIAAALNHPPSAITAFAERNFLRRMGGGCNVPVAAYARLEKDILKMEALVASPDGSKIVRDSVHGNLDDADEAVASLSDRILSRGGREILLLGTHHDNL
jgi:hydroxymethylbilane synthase